MVFKEANNLYKLSIKVIAAEFVYFPQMGNHVTSHAINLARFKGGGYYEEGLLPIFTGPTT